MRKEQKIIKRRGNGLAFIATFNHTFIKCLFDTKHLVIKMSLIHFSEMKTDVKRERIHEREEK